MPLNINLQQILLHALNFVILFGALYFLLYKPVRDFMDSRKAHYEICIKKMQRSRKKRTHILQEALHFVHASGINKAAF